jgi:dTDP-4-amino-4,6-dideoxygalactose transaminase
VTKAVARSMSVGAVFAQLSAKAKPWLRPLVRVTLAKLPRPATRLKGALAKDGGVPVRNTRYRPWPTDGDGSFLQWHTEVRARLRGVFLSGIEGLPQPLARDFAQQWAAYCGCRYGLLLPHGTDALRIGLAAAFDHDGLGYGGEVIVPNFSFIASATAPLDRRFGVALVDVDPQTLLLDPVKVEEAIIPGRTRAILPVHLFGQPADMTVLRAIAKKHGLKIIEDAAQAHGAVWQDGAVGSLGDVGAFSFQSSKNLACGEGGALVTNNERIFERAHSIHNAGRAPIDGGRWVHERLGWNCRPTEYQATILLHRFKSFDRMQEVRRRNFERLLALMADIRCLVPVTIDRRTRKHGMYMLALRYRPEHCNGLALDDFLSYVGGEGAPIYRAFELTISEQPAIRALRQRHPDFFRCLPTPVADQAVKDTLYIAQQVFLGTPQDMEDIAAAIRKVERHFSSRGPLSR